MNAKYLNYFKSSIILLVSRWSILSYKSIYKSMYTSKTYSDFKFFLFGNKHPVRFMIHIYPRFFWRLRKVFLGVCRTKLLRVILRHRWNGYWHVWYVYTQRISSHFYFFYLQRMIVKIAHWNKITWNIAIELQLLWENI